MTDLIRPCDVAKDLAVLRTWAYDAANTGRIPLIRMEGRIADCGSCPRISIAGLTKPGKRGGRVGRAFLRGPM
jgi:hypothetical protein